VENVPTILGGICRANEREGKPAQKGKEEKGEPLTINSS
jgi:hypothetical protein